MDYQEMKTTMLINQSINSKDLRELITSSIADKSSTSDEDILNTEDILNIMDKHIPILFKLESETEVAIIQDHLKGLNPTELVDELLFLLDNLCMDDLGNKTFDYHKDYLKVYLDANI